MSLHELKDIGEAVEKLRRLRNDLGDCDARDAVDRQLVRLTEHLEGVIGDDQRLRHRLELRREAIAACPEPERLTMHEVQGRMTTVLDLMLKGASAAVAWKKVLGLD